MNDNIEQRFSTFEGWQLTKQNKKTIWRPICNKKVYYKISFDDPNFDRDTHVEQEIDHYFPTQKLSILDHLKSVI